MKLSREEILQFERVGILLNGGNITYARISSSRYAGRCVKAGTRLADSRSGEAIQLQFRLLVFYDQVLH
ncbi:MAG: hypothetical protein HOC70_10800 [Gammaproteobacteria bacterium]|nr:hypothetical protein [Gammaproteobacteria bacterium]